MAAGHPGWQGLLSREADCELIKCGGLFAQHLETSEQWTSGTRPSGVPGGLAQWEVTPGLILPTSQCCSLGSSPYLWWPSHWHPHLLCSTTGQRSNWMPTSSCVSIGS